MNVEIIEAGPELKSVVCNLGRYYIHDFTEFIGFRCSETGLYRADCWDKYWQQPGHCAFLVKVDGELAGFVLIENQGVLPQTQWSIGEFFIMRKFRRRGIGRQVAFSMFDRFRGRWEVRQVVQNAPATAFWRKVIDRYTDGKYHELPEPVRHGQWTDIVQTFDNARTRPTGTRGESLGL